MYQEVEALTELSNALYTLVTSQTMNYIKKEIVARTIFASLMSSLAPVAWLKIGRIIGELTAGILRTRTTC